MHIFYCRRDTVIAVLVILVLILIGIIVYSTNRYASREAIFSFPLLGYGVVIDPGHGGYDPGVKRDEICEKDIVLEISRYIELMLGRKGTRIVMTRDDDEDPVSYTHLDVYKRQSQYGDLPGSSVCPEV